MSKNLSSVHRKRNRFGRQTGHGFATGNKKSRRVSRRGNGIPIWLLWTVILGVAGGMYAGHTGGLDRMIALAAVPAEDTLVASFSICGESRRADCVVDGDTFWFQGEKIRIADIDTPELSPPRCTSERIKGEAAKARLLVLLKAGKFSMSAGFRDEDKYGRKLRTVTRNGQSVGDILVHEGLARRWEGARRSWCDS